MVNHKDNELFPLWVWKFTVEFFNCLPYEVLFNFFFLFGRLVDAHVFSFVVAKALVTEIEKLKKLSSTGCLDVEKILQLFMESSKVVIMQHPCKLLLQFL